jgi:hypothetical protein
VVSNADAKVYLRMELVFSYGKDESVEHALLFCSFSRKVWQEIKRKFPLLLQRHFTSPLILVLNFLVRCSDLDAKTIITTMWHIGQGRNRVREGKNLMRLRTLATKVKFCIEMILQHLFKLVSNEMREVSLTYKWSLPCLA